MQTKLVLNEKQNKTLRALTSFLNLKVRGEHLKNFLKFSRSTEHETSLSFLYRFDDAIADAVDRLKLAVDETES